MKNDTTIKHKVISEMITILQKCEYMPIIKLFYDVKVDNGEYEKHLNISPMICEDENVSFAERINMSLDRFRKSNGYNLFGEGKSLVRMTKCITINDVTFDCIRELMEFPIDGCTSCEFIRFVYDDSVWNV